MRDFKKTGLRNISSLVAKTGDMQALATRIREFSIVNMWPQVVQETISKATVATKLEDGTLYVICKSPTWANELTLLSQEIIGKINKEAKSKMVREIRFTTRGFNKAKEAQIKKGAEEETRVEPDTKETKEKADRFAKDLAKGVEDEELRDRVERAVRMGKIRQIVLKHETEEE